MATGTLNDTLRETLAVFESAGEPRSTPEVAERLDLGRRSTYNRLERLVDQGALETKKVGANARVWWRPPGTDPGERNWPAAAESLVDDVLDDLDAGIFVLDENLDVAWINEATERYFGLDREAVLGRDKRTVVEERVAPTMADSTGFRRRMHDAYDEDPDSEQFECHVTDGEDRAERWLEHWSKPIESGAYAGGRVELYYDVTEQKRSERAHAADRREFESLVQAVEEYAIFTLDTAGRVQTWNEGAARIKGYDREEILGKHFSTFYTEDDRAAHVPEWNLARAERDGSTSDVGWRLQSDGSRFWANVTITAVRDDDGNLDGFVKVTRDMTERKRTESERRLLYDTTRAIAEADTFECGMETALQTVCETTDWEYGEAWLPSEDGTLRLADATHVDGDFESFARFSEDIRFERGVGLPGRVWESETYEWAENLPDGSPEEYPRLDRALEVGVQSSVGVPIVADDEVVAVLTFLTTNRREADERTVESISSVADELGNLVVRRQTEARMERERNLVERIFETVSVGIAVLETDGDVVRINEHGRDVLGVSEDDSILPADERTVYDEDGQRVPVEERPFVHTVETGESVHDWQCQIERPDGDRSWLSTHTAPLYDEDGAVDKVVVVAEDITQFKQQARRLERQRDDLKAELDDVFTRIDDSFFALDEELRFVHFNEQAETVLGRSAGDLVGQYIWDAFEYDETVAETYEEALETQESRSLETYYEPLEAWFEIHAYPSDTGLSVYFRDITDRKERERELERYETLFEKSKDVSIIVDAEGRFQFVTPSSRDVLGYDPEELVDEVGFDYVHPDDREMAMEEFTKLLERPDYEPEIEIRFEHADGSWIHIEALARDLRDDDDVDGIVVYTRDVTERTERERKLERYESIVKTVDDGVYAVDQDGYYTQVNETYASMTPYSREELLGSHVSKAIDDETVLREAQRIEDELVAGERETASLEATLTNADGEEVIGEAKFAIMDSPEGYERIGVVRDVTERNRRERELEESQRRLHTLLENFPNGAVVLLDEDLRYQAVGGSPAHGDAPEDLEGRQIDEAIAPEHADFFVEKTRAALDGETSRFERTVDDRIYQFHILPVRDHNGDVFGVMGMSQDVTEQRRRERDLKRRVRQQEVVTHLGQRALERHDVDELMAEAAELVAETLDNDYCKVLDLDDDGAELLLRQGVGWQEGIVGEATVSATDDDSQAAYTLRSEEPVVVEDLATESRFSGPDLLTDHDVRSGISTIIGPADDPWGILGTHDTAERSFQEQDANFVRSVANILASAIDRHYDELELARQRQQLSAINNISSTVRDITEAVIEQSTREEIETTVCERLADTDSYEFAWIGEIDTESQEVVPRVKAGGEGYIDEITVTVDPDDERAEGPSGRALRTGEISTTDDVRQDADFEPWRDYAEAYDVRSSAAIPITHEDTVYGVLNVYSVRPAAFEGREREVIGQLGEVVGHAIAAIERKRALMSDEVTEISFVLPDILDDFGVDVDADGTIEFERAVPTGDEQFVEYGTADREGIEILEALVDRLDHFETLSVADREADTTRFELRMSEPPVVSMVASNGGYLERAMIEDGDFHLTIHLPPTVDTRRVIDSVKEVYPMATLQARRQVSRDDDTLPQVHRAVTSELSDRQRATLEAAVYSGFFDWPRETTGNEVAESLGIAPSTFSQHLRKAQGKVFESLFGTPTTG